MKKTLMTMAFICLAMVMVRSQDRRHVLGARAGLNTGITYEYRVDPFRGYKAMLSYREGGIQLTALLQTFRPLYLRFTDKMHYYIGMGGHVGFTRFEPRWNIFANPFHYNYRYGRFAPVIGLDAIVGLEYRLDRAPVIFALDAKPFFELFGQNIFRVAFVDIGLSIKFTF